MLTVSYRFMVERFARLVIRWCAYQDNDPLPGYQDRYVLLKWRKWFPVMARVHRIYSPDHDRALHTHPINSVSFILRNGYREHLPLSQSQAFELDQLVQYERIRVRRAGALVFRNSRSRHRLSLFDDSASSFVECWSIFIMWGWSRRAWGFCVPGSIPFLWWRNYTGEWHGVTPEEILRAKRTLGRMPDLPIEVRHALEVDVDGPASA